MASEDKTIPEEFTKVISDFVRDIQRTFPEYGPFIQKWWKTSDDFKHIEDEDERLRQFTKRKEADVMFLYKFCYKKYPPRFFEILNHDVSIFSEDSEIDTEFLPFVHFKNLWQDDISEDTRTTIWKYLQLILFSVVNNVKDKNVFGEASQMFQDMDENDFKDKLDNALDEIKGIFENKVGEDGEQTEIPMHNAEDLHSHLSGMFSGKLGDLAREIAEETAQEINMDTDGATDVKDVFNKMFQNPGKLMGLAQTVGSKLEDKMKSGDISEAELMREASEMMTKMKDIPGMGDMQSMLSKLGLNKGGGKVDVKGMQHRMGQEMRKQQARENAKKMAEKKRQQQSMAQANVKITQEPMYTDEEIINMMSEVTPEPSNASKKKKKKKKNKAKSTEIEAVAEM